MQGGHWGKCRRVTRARFCKAWVCLRGPSLGKQFLRPPLWPTLCGPVPPGAPIQQETDVEKHSQSVSHDRGPYHKQHTLPCGASTMNISTQRPGKWRRREADPLVWVTQEGKGQQDDKGVGRPGRSGRASQKKNLHSETEAQRQGIS